MPVRYRRAPMARRRASRRRTVWATTQQNPTAVAAGALSTVGLVSDLVTAGVGIIGGTVVRVHSRLSVASTTSDTSPGCVYGWIVWDTTITKPDPTTDVEIPWMHWAFLAPGTANGPLVVSTSILYGETVDSRAKRKLPQLNDRLFFELHNSGSASLTYSLACRALIALP